jgi:hypothetical protein
VKRGPLDQYGENTHTERDVLTSCFRAESPRSATGIALSGFCSTKFLLLFFGLRYRSAQVGGKAPAHGGRSRLIRVCRRKGFNFGRQGRLTTAVNSCGATSVALGFILIAQSLKSRHIPSTKAPYHTQHAKVAGSRQGISLVKTRDALFAVRFLVVG